jgi:SAM-dependent methyltransferase
MANASTMAPADSTERMTAIKGFWNEQARKHGTDLAATTPDPIAKDLEIGALKRHLDPALDTLEIGCGNGTDILRLLDHLRSRRVVGIDYAEDMIEAAKKSMSELSLADRSRVAVDVGDIMKDLTPLGRFSQIFTVRCLINLPTLDHQLQAVRNIDAILKPGGRLVLVESTKQGQERLNAMREAVGLEPISYHWHNLYLDQDAFLAGLPRHLKVVAIDSFASLYFVISRVFNAKMTPPGRAPDYLAEINTIAGQLPSIGDNAPLKLFVIQKEGRA